MVQLYTFSPWDQAGPGNYWKLDSAYRCQKRGLRKRLEESGHSAITSGCGTTARLRLLYIRRQRGLLSFEGLPLHELRHYANLRGILVDPDATATIVKAQLEKADNEATFNSFTELPPEIRQIIFQYYYESLPSHRCAPRKYQPPITMASRMIREESLPLFYDYCGHLKIFSDGPVAVPYKLSPSTSAARVLQSTPTHLLGRIKSLRLNFFNLGCNVPIDLRNCDEPIGNVIINREGYSNRSWNATGATEARRQHVISALRTLAASIAARPGPLKFRTSDIDDMGEMLRRIFMDGTASQ